MSYNLSDSIKCLDGVDYEVVKHNPYFEWVVESEKTIKQLALEVFETIGVKNDKALDVVLKGLEGYQAILMIKMDELVKKVTDKADVKEQAKSFVAEWSEAVKYQVVQKYHRAGDGPNAHKLRWAFESVIKYVIICATHLVDQVESVDFKKDISDFIKNVIIKLLIDSMDNVKSELKEVLENSM